MAKKISKSDISEDDIFGAIRQSAETTITIIDQLSAALTETAETVKKSIGGAKFDSTKAIDNFVKSTEKANKIQQEAAKLDQQRSKAVKERNVAMGQQQKRMQEVEKTKQQAIKTEETLARQKKRLNAEAERNARVTKNEASEYKKLELNTRNLKNQSKELAATMLRLSNEGKKNTREYRILATEYKNVTAEAKRGDTALKSIDSTVGDNFRNVGNYSSALKGLGTMFTQLAGGFGVMQLVKGAGGIIVDFDQAVGDLAAISGKSKEELSGLTEQAKQLGATTQFSATQITEMQIELAKLGFTSEQISASTGAVANFAAATGADIPAAAALAGSALRGFGMDVSEMDRVVSVMGVATTKTALDFAKLETGLSTIAPVANAFGFSIEDTTALLGQLANAGFDASSAATATRNILLNLADSGGDLAKELGRPIKSADDLAEGLKELQAKGIDLGEALELTDKRSVAAFNTFLEGSDSLVELRDSITDVNDELEEMAKKKLDTIGGQFTLLQSAWEGFILSMNEGSGIGGMVKATLGFLATNLSRIMSVLGSVIIAWGMYKTVLLSVRIANFAASGGFKDMGKNLLAYIRNIGKMTDKTKTAGTAVKGFGNAMKGVPFILILTALIEISKAFYDIATNAKEAAAAQAKAAKIAEDAAKTSSKRSGERAKLLAEEIAANERLLRNKEKTEAQVRVMNEEAIKKTRERAKEDRKAVNDRNATLKKDVDFLETYAKKSNGIVMSGWQSDKDFAKAMDNLGFKDLAENMRQGSVNAGEFDAMITITNAKIQSGWSKWRVYNDEVEEYGFQMDEAKTQTFETADANKNLSANLSNVTSGVKTYNTEFKNTINLLNEYNDLMRDRRQLEQDISQIDQEKIINNLDDQIKEEVDAQRRKAETTGQIDVDLAESLINQKAELRKVAIEQETKFEIQELKLKLEEEQKLRRDALQIEYEQLIIGADGNADAIQKIENNHQSELAKLRVVEELENGNLRNEEIKIFKESREDIEDVARETAEELNNINEDLIQEQINFAMKQSEISIANAKATADAIVDAEKKMWQDRMDIANVATDFLTQLSDRRIKKLDDEIAKAETQADFLRTLAENGNIDAKDSLAEQQRIIDEANKKKIQEEKLKAKVEFANTVFQTYGSKVQAGSQSPLVDTIKDVTLLQQFIGAFTPTYLDGTEDTGTNGRGIDGKGGFQAILHPNERVLTKEQNKKVGGMNNEALAQLAQEYQNGTLRADNATQIGNGWDSHLVVKRLESIESAIKNKPEHSLDIENVVIGAMDIVRSTKRGGDVVYNRYKVKK